MLTEQTLLDYIETYRPDERLARDELWQEVQIVRTWWPGMPESREQFDAWLDALGAAGLIRCEDVLEGEDVKKVVWRLKPVKVQALVQSGFAW